MGLACWCLIGINWPVMAKAQLQRLPSPASSLQQASSHDTAFNGLNTLPYDSPSENIGHNLNSQPTFQPKCWTWQLFPEGLIYRSYLAGGREPRLASKWVYEREQGWLWDLAAGGRVGILRYGTEDDVLPEGWQLDVEGAAFPRLTLLPERDRDMVAADFRVGLPLTFRRGMWEGKFSYYHLSSHLGDEYMETFPTVNRINYVRDAFVLAVALRPNPDLRLYTEAGWAFNADGGAKPWEFQFGVDYCSTELTGFRATPFLALNGRIREELDFGGSFTAQAGLAWRARTGQLIRFGLHYFNGKSDQYQFFTEHEEQIGLGLWYDY